MDKITTIQEAKHFLRSNFAKGAPCPACSQLVKRYRRPITNTMAYALILIERHFRTNTDWLHVPSYLSEMSKVGSAVRGGDWAKLRYWGLIEAQPGDRGDGSTRNGFYKITTMGRSFVSGVVRVPKHVYIYNQTVLDEGPQTGESVSIREALGKKFNYDELMTS